MDDDSTRSLIKKISYIVSPILLWFLIALGVFLRTYQADLFPLDNNDDGLFYSWSGVSLWHDPLNITSLSIFEKDNPALLWRSQYRGYDVLNRFSYILVNPWYDQPPLGTFFAGLPAYLLNYKSYSQLPHLLVRLPALIASLFTLLGTYLLAKRWFGDRPAWLSLLIMATVPYFVFAHRQSYLENFLTPMMLFSIVFLFNYFDTKKKRWLISSTLLSGFAGLIKIIGFSIPFMNGAWLWFKKETMAAFIVAGYGALVLLTYIGINLWSNKEAFLFTMAQQGTRGSFPSSFFDALTYPHFYGGFPDGWYVLGLGLLIFTLLTIKQTSKHFAYSWFAFSWLITLFIFSGRFNNSPWYRYPLLPFMAIATGWWLHKVWKQPTWFNVLPFFLLGITGFDLLQLELPSTILRASTLLFFGILIVCWLKTKNVWLQKTNLILSRSFLVLLVLLNIYVVIQFPKVHCKAHDCITPVRIPVSIN